MTEGQMKASPRTTSVEPSHQMVRDTMALKQLMPVGRGSAKVTLTAEEVPARRDTWLLKGGVQVPNIMNLITEVTQTLMLKDSLLC